MTIVALAATGLVIIATFGWSKVQRPVPIEDRMPVADSVEQAGNGEESMTSQKGAGSTDVDPPEVADAGGDGQIVVHIAGAVASPGIVTLRADSRVADAVTAAGGLRADADPDRLNLAEILSDGVRIVVPALGQETLPEPAEITGTGNQGQSGNPESQTPTPPVNLNTATAQDLEKLPGVGPATSAAIITKRERDGRFTSVDSLLDVRGIGDAKLEAIRDLVTVD